VLAGVLDGRKVVEVARRLHRYRGDPRTSTLLVGETNPDRKSLDRLYRAGGLKAGTHRRNMP
jgi:hypothetical protein